eukprot:jgi/Astpho2/7287/Aster-01593
MQQVNAPQTHGGSPFPPQQCPAGACIRSLATNAGPLHGSFSLADPNTTFAIVNGIQATCSDGTQLSLQAVLPAAHYTQNWTATYNASQMTAPAGCCFPGLNIYSVAFNTTSAGVYTIFSGVTTFTRELLSLTAGTPGLPLGGLSDVANCLPGQYISGISGNSGNAFDSVQFNCSQMQVDCSDAGIVIGGVVLLCLLATLLVLYVRRRGRLNYTKGTKMLDPAQYSNSNNPTDHLMMSSLAVTSLPMELHERHINSPGLTDWAGTAVSNSSGTCVSVGAPQQPALVASNSSGARAGMQALASSAGTIPLDRIQLSRRPDGSEWRLGSGAFGDVFRGVWDGVHPVAVKRFKGAFLEGRVDISNELEVLKLCRHRNILQFYGVAVAGDEVMLITELMEGGDLGRALLRPESSALFSWYNKGKHVALEIASGLHYLHNMQPHPIMHLDLKTGNVLLDQHGNAKLGDVGLSCALTKTHLSHHNSPGTWAYCAPEIMMGESVSVKADIYSFGVTLHEIITGEPPQRGRLRQIWVPQEAPAEVVELWHNCCHKDPEMRPGTREIIATLQALLHALPPPDWQALSRFNP